MSQEPKAGSTPETEPAGGPDPDRPCAGHETRCGCGRLLLKQFPQGWEVKCPRCKRRWFMRFRQSGAFRMTMTLIPCDSRRDSEYWPVSTKEQENR
jgi:hypothetical protein